MGFLPMDDPRIVGTVEAIEKKLMKDGFRGAVRHFKKSARTGCRRARELFLACSFWMVINLYLDRAARRMRRTMFERLLALRNDVGLLAEEWDHEWQADGGEFSAGVFAYHAGCMRRIRFRDSVEAGGLASQAGHAGRKGYATRHAAGLIRT